MEEKVKEKTPETAEAPEATTAEAPKATKGPKASKVLQYLQIPLIVCFAAAIAWGALLYIRWTRAEQQQQALIELHNEAISAQEDGEGLEKLLAEQSDPLREINGDYVGWLTVYGTSIQQPVVQRPGDNEHYLNHDFYGVWSSFGCLYADGGVDLSKDGNILIHGHNMKNGTMLGGLTEYENISFFSEHDLITLEREGEEAFYEIFALLATSGYEDEADYFPIGDYINERSESETEGLLAALEERAIYWRDLDMDGTDRFLFLLTSDYSEGHERLLLCARRLAV